MLLQRFINWCVPKGFSMKFKIEDDWDDNDDWDDSDDEDWEDDD